MEPDAQPNALLQPPSPVPAAGDAATLGRFTSDVQAIIAGAAEVPPANVYMDIYPGSVVSAASSCFRTRTCNRNLYYMHVHVCICIGIKGLCFTADSWQRLAGLPTATCSTASSIVCTPESPPSITCRYMQVPLPTTYQ